MIQWKQGQFFGDEVIKKKQKTPMLLKISQNILIIIWDCPNTDLKVT